MKKLSIKEKREFFIVIGLTIILYTISSTIGVLERGYDATGGEIMILTIPAIYYAIKLPVEEKKQTMKVKRVKKVTRPQYNRY